MVELRPTVPRWLGPRVQVGCALIIVATASWFALFNRLDAQPMQVVDEIRLADNAIEMAATGDLLVTRYDGEPETWNTKPPLQIWLEASTVKLLGVRPLAFRLPSALAALATVLLLFLFTRRQLGTLWGAVFAAVLLLSSSGFVLVHTARNGEYDALLVLWMFASSLAFFTFVRSGERKWLWLTALFVVLAVYTKGIQGLIFLPGFVVYVAVAGRFKAVFGQRRVYAAGGVALLAIASYYLGREQLQPGYLHAVWQNELGGRYAAVNEGHNAGFLAYVLALGWWTVILLYGLLLLPLMKGADRSVGIFTMTVSTSYLVAISLSKTKLQWYADPVYPLLALLALVSVRSLIAALRPKKAWARPVVIALAGGAAAWSVSSLAIKIDQHHYPHAAEERYPQQLDAFRTAFPGTKHIVLGTPAYEGPSLYYQEYFATRGLRLDLQGLHGLSLERGDTILTSVDAIKKRLHNDYVTERIFSFEGMDGEVVERARLLQAKGVRSNEKRSRRAQGA